MNSKKQTLIIGVLIGLSIIGTPLLKADAGQASAAATRPDLDYLKAVNQAGPPQDPQLLFLLMVQYAASPRLFRTGFMPFQVLSSRNSISSSRTIGA